jgi:hypothetical protein
MKLKKIAIHSVPRSGSTWLGSMVDSSPQTVYRFQPLFSYAHKGQLDENASLDEINIFFKDIWHTDDFFVLQQEAKARQIVPQFPKVNPTHLVYKEVRYHHIIENLLVKDPEIFIIGLVRSPFATIHSWLNAPKEFKKELGWKVAEEWRNAPLKNLNKPEEFNGYEKWKEVTKLFVRLREEYPNQFYLLSYEELLKNTEDAMKKVFDFCGLNFSDQTESFVKKSTSNAVKDDDAYSVFKSKSKDDAWKKDLPGFIVETIKADPDFTSLNKKYNWI